MAAPAFIEPRLNRLVLGIARVALPAMTHLMAGIREIRVSDEDLEHIISLRSGRAILSPNHPTGNDPYIPFYLSMRVREPFHYLAAREAFVGFRGWMMHQAGAYSITRGITDRQSIRTTRNLLAEKDRKVVIFPEGEIYEYNDTLIEFQSGVAQMGFWALDDLARLKKQPRMPLLPLAFKYRCAESPRPAIENSLRDLESALSLPRDNRLGSYARLHRVGMTALAAAEKDIRLDVPADLPLAERIPAFRRAVLSRVAQTIGCSTFEDQPPADQIHLLHHALLKWVGEIDRDASSYEWRLYRRRVSVAQPLFGQLIRLRDMIAMTGDYVLRHPTAERFLDVLNRLEGEVLGHVRNRVLRDALVRVGEPISLESRYDEYRLRRREVVGDVTAELEASIRGMLAELSQQGTPISLTE